MGLAPVDAQSEIPPAKPSLKTRLSTLLAEYGKLAIILYLVIFALVSKRAKDAGFGLMFMLAELASARITHAIEPSMGATSLAVVAREAKKRGLILISERAVALLQKSGG